MAMRARKPSVVPRPIVARANISPRKYAPGGFAALSTIHRFSRSEKAQFIARSPSRNVRVWVAAIRPPVSVRAVAKPGRIPIRAKKIT